MRPEVDIQYGWEEGHETIRCCERLTVLPYFGVGNIVEQHIRVGIAQLSVLAQVTPAVARKVVYQRHVDHQIGFTCKVDNLNLKVVLF